MLTMEVCFLFCIILSISHGFLLTNKTGISSVGTQGLTDGHYLILTDALSIQKQLLARMETFVLQLQNQLQTVNQEVKDLKSGNSATQSLAVAALKNESVIHSFVIAKLKNESASQLLDVANLKNESAAQMLDVAELKKQFGEQKAQLENSYDILKKKYDTLQNENNVLKHDNAAMKSQITDWHNFSIYTKQELDSFTHSIAASNIKNVTTIQSNVESLTSEMKSLNSRLNSLSSTSTSRSQDFLALLNKIHTAELKLDTFDSWSKSFQNYTNNQFILLQFQTNSSSDRFDSLEQNFALVSNEIWNITGKVQAMNQPVALTSCAVSGDYNSGQIIKFQSTKTSIGITNVDEFKSTGKFTCEKSGVYLFAVYITYYGSSDADFKLSKNGQTISYVMVVYGTHGNNYFSGSGTVVVQMNAGDILLAKTDDKMHIHGGYSCFTVLKIN